CKLDERTITSCFDDPASMLCDLGIDKIASARLERCESTLLVNTHEPAVASDINCEDGGQPSFDPRLDHENCPYSRDFGRSLWSRGRCVYLATMSAVGQKRTNRRWPKPTFVRFGRWSQPVDATPWGQLAINNDDGLP